MRFYMLLIALLFVSSIGYSQSNFERYQISQRTHLDIPLNAEEPARLVQTSDNQIHEILLYLKGGKINTIQYKRFGGEDVFIMDQMIYEITIEEIDWIEHFVVYEKRFLSLTNLNSTEHINKDVVKKQLSRNHPKCGTIFKAAGIVLTLFYTDSEVIEDDLSLQDDVKQQLLQFCTDVKKFFLEPKDITAEQAVAFTFKKILKHKRPEKTLSPKEKDKFTRQGLHYSAVHISRIPILKSEVTLINLSGEVYVPKTFEKYWLVYVDKKANLKWPHKTFYVLIKVDRKPTQKIQYKVQYANSPPFLLVNNVVPSVYKLKHVISFRR